MDRFYRDGGTVLPPGGIVGGMDPEMMPPEDGELTRMSLEQIQLIPPEELQSIVIEAKQALDGTHPDPEAALEIFLLVFGEQELASLKEAVIQEMEGGPPALPEEGDPSLMSDGMSDSIPANIDGMEPAALSEGEYVVPADAVSGLGNGDTNSGARRLEEMIGKIRSVRGGMPQAPPAMDPMSVMPPGAGGYAMGGPVKSFSYAEGGLVDSIPESNPVLSSALFNFGTGSSLPFDQTLSPGGNSGYATAIEGAAGLLGAPGAGAFGAPPSPVNVMDSYPGGDFESRTPDFVPTPSDFVMNIDPSAWGAMEAIIQSNSFNPYLYNSGYHSTGTAPTGISGWNPETGELTLPSYMDPDYRPSPATSGQGGFQYGALGRGGQIGADLGWRENMWDVYGLQPGTTSFASPSLGGPSFSGSGIGPGSGFHGNFGSGTSFGSLGMGPEFSF